MIVGLDFLEDRVEITLRRQVTSGVDPSGRISRWWKGPDRPTLSRGRSPTQSLTYNMEYIFPVVPRWFFVFLFAQGKTSEGFSIFF